MPRIAVVQDSPVLLDLDHAWPDIFHLEVTRDPETPVRFTGDDEPR